MLLQEAGRTQKADMTGGHSVLISSEEQFKVFSLPTLRPRNKEKLTAVDGSRVRKLGVVDVPGKTPGKWVNISKNKLTVVLLFV